MKILLDTSVVYGVMKYSPDPRVLGFFDGLEKEELYFSVIGEPEIYFSLPEEAGSLFSLWLYSNSLRI